MKTTMRTDPSGFQTRWSDELAERYLSEGHWSNTTLVDSARAALAADPDHLLLIEGKERLSRQQCWDQALRLAGFLLSRGLKPGDVVSFQLPNWMESAVIALATRMTGLVINPIPPIYRESELAYILADCRAKLIFVPGTFRKHDFAAMLKGLRGSLPELRDIVVVRDAGELTFEAALAHPAANEADLPKVDPSAVMMVMYTSGTTGKPKGILHTTGGYLTHVATTFEIGFDLKPDDVFWTAADIGWITGHSYIVYGPLANGVTQVLYEGTPDGGGRDRWWRIIEELGVTVLYTAPTVIRTFMKWGEEHPGGHDLRCLRILGSVGEPINPDAWVWYRSIIGGGRCPVVDTWWQTETGGWMVMPLPGLTASKPGAAMAAFPGISIDVVDDKGDSVANGHGGSLVITAPWPGMLRGIWGDPERYRQTYWSEFEGRYFPGDAAKRDEDGDIWLLGRVDDEMYVAGHRLSTAEIEGAIVGHPAVAEAAVVGVSDEEAGQAVVAFVTLRKAGEVAQKHAAQLVEDIRAHVASVVTPAALPRQVILTPDLPKTRSGKIMRRLLRDVAEHRPRDRRLLSGSVGRWVGGSGGQVAE